MAYSVTLTVGFQSDYLLNESLGFRITVTASAPSADLQGLPSNLSYGIAGATNNVLSATSVFRYVQKPANPSGVIESVFSGVCSWPDYTELGLAPESDTLPAGFRQNSIDLVVESETVANEIWLLLQTQVSQLMQTISDGQSLDTATFVASSL